MTFLTSGERATTGNVWRQSVDGSDLARLMIRSDRSLSEQVWKPDGTGPEYSPAVSPNGKWLAFSSNSSGRFEVCVVPTTVARVRLL